MNEFAYHVTNNEKYPYQLTQRYEYQLPVSWPPIEMTIVTPYVTLTLTHMLVLQKGYSWNGANVVPDGTKILRASVIHDALCQLIGMGKLPKSPYRKLADQTLYHICRMDGMSWIAATTMYYAVRFYAHIIKPIKQWWRLS